MYIIIFGPTYFLDNPFGALNGASNANGNDLENLVAQAARTNRGEGWETYSSPNLDRI